MSSINEVFAFLAQDPEGEAIVGINTPGGFLPFVGGNMNQIEILKPFAEQIAQKTGRSIKILKFTNREELQEINP